MTDAEFTIFQTVVALVLTFIDAGLLTILFVPYLPAYKLHKSRRIIKCISIFAVYSVISVIGVFIPHFEMAGMIEVVILMGLIAPVLENNRFFVIFLTMVFFCFDCLIGLAGNSLLYLLNINFVDDVSVEVALRNTAFHYAGVYFIQSIILAILVFVIRRVVKQSLQLNIKEWGYLCILPLIGIIFKGIVDRLLFVVKNHVVFGIYNDYPAFLVFVPMIAVLFCVGIILTIVSYQEMKQMEDDKKKYFVQEQQVKAIQERIDEVEQFYNGIRKMRHEMKNHLTNIKGLVENKNYADIDQYISKIDSELDYFELSVRTGNSVLDVIINDKKKLAEKENIQFESDFLYPVSDNYDPYDIGIIVNNLLINAIEACERMKGGDRYISISSKQKKKFYIIEVTNSCEGEIRMDEGSGLPVTTKDGITALHGIGLLNVREEAFKYMGDIDVKKTANSFCATVLLQEINKKKGGKEYES